MALRYRILFVFFALLGIGCGGHASRTQEIRTALDAGLPKRALALVNEELGVDRASDLPADVSGDQAILILDRAMILQALDQYKLSARDLGVADKQVEVLDLSRNATADLGRYLFSDSSGPYRAPAYEKLMINTMNMVNYLAEGDLNGSRVEARRLAVMQKFIAEHEDPANALVGPGSYLAGFTFEKSGKYDEALRYYDEALKYGTYGSLESVVKRLASVTSYRSPRIRKLLGEAPPTPPPAAPKSKTEGATEPKPDAIPEAKPDATDAEPEPRLDAKPKTEPEAKPDAKPAAKPPPPAQEDGELLVIVSFGRVPAKYAKRIPIGLALTYASGAISPTDQSKANAIAAQGLVTWINYPELGKARGKYDVPEFALDGQWQRLEGALAVDLEAKKAWEAARGAVIASAITRMIARVVAGEAVRRGSGGGAVGLLLSLGTQATLVAADTPDTRCWATLPARIAFGRVRVKPGRHVVILGARSLRKRQEIIVKPGGFQVVSFTALH